MAKKQRKYKRPAAARPAANQGGQQVRRGESQIRLSQCMIVKNEERNIEKALSWGKDIVCEQIVVDTGSTDRTAEIARQMGAKVFHFEWINDFAAAKNYAIEQASGNWIAFLDADEYITEDDAGIVIPFLEHIMADPKMRRGYLAVTCPWIQLDDNGKPKEIYEQERIFQNLPKVRYVNMIHEHLTLEPKDVVYTEDFRIMHTGYTGDSFLQTGKASRNIELLRLQLEKNPDDMKTKAYLAESLRAELAVNNTVNESPDAKERTEALHDEMDRLYTEVYESGADVPPLLKKSTYEYYLRDYLNATAVDPEMDALCEKAYKEFPKDHKFMCYYAMALNKKREYSRAFDVLKKCEDSLERTMGTLGSSSALTTKIMGIFTAQMVLAAQGLGDIENVLKYAEILVLMDKKNSPALPPYIATLMNYHKSIDEVLSVLGHIYDLSSKSDLLIIARAAKNCNAIDLARRIVEVAMYLGDD